MKLVMAAAIAILLGLPVTAVGAQDACWDCFPGSRDLDAVDLQGEYDGVFDNQADLREGDRIGIGLCC